MNTSLDHTERVCDVTLYNLTGPSDPFQFLDSFTAIQLTRIQNVEDLNVILSAFGPLHHLGELDGKSGHDKYALSSLVTFMEKKQQVGTSD